MHMPERWGYLQFSTKPVGSATFRPDPAGPARDLLHRVYHVQHEYRKKHARFATSLDALGLKGLTHKSLAGSFEIEATSNWFEAAVPVKVPDDTARRWHIRADSKVWNDGP